MAGKKPSFMKSCPIKLLDSDLSAHPVCRHGPTLLFQDINHKTYYSCSSCRNRKDCDFYMSSEEWLKIGASNEGKAKYLKTVSTHSEHNYFYDKSVKQMPKNEIKFCQNCSLIISSKDQLSGHESHEILCEISRKLFRNPTELMNSLTNNKFCAQYLFANKTKKFLINEVIQKNGFNHVVCIGCPSIHEYIDCRKNRLKIKSILLDIDDRYKQFYSPKKFLKYNLFNDYFFDGSKSANTFSNFIEGSPKDSIIILIDPPFGGLIEAMAKTMNKINEFWQKCNQISDKKQMIAILLFFPYFNEKRIITTIPSLQMSDFMVDYRNHNKFNSKSSGRKFGSPVRIFTNIKLSSIVLPKTEGYHYCDDCLKYVSINNKHCFECDDCTARDGKPYNHCHKCKKCFKQTWSHCSRCDVCHLRESCLKRGIESNYNQSSNKKTKQ